MGQRLWTRVGMAIAILTPLTSCDPGSEEPGPDPGAEESPAQITIYLSDEQGIQIDCAAVRAESWTLPEPRPDDVPSAAVSPGAPACFRLTCA